MTAERLTAEQQLLVERNVRLAQKVAWRLVKSGIAQNDPSHNANDFLGIAYVGLCKAARAFDPGRGLRFSTCAYTFILWELRKYLRDCRPGGIRWRRTVPWGEQPPVVRLDNPMSDGAGAATLLEHTPDGQAEVELKVILRLAIERLRPRERIVVRLVADGWTQQRIADRLGVSQAEVSRTMREAYQFLRLILDDGVDRMTLTELERAILAAMQSLPPGSPVRRIGQAVGQEVKTGDMRRLVAGGLVAEVDRREGPMTGYTLTPVGENTAADIRWVRHPTIHTPEMAAPVPVLGLRERISRDDLKQALREGQSLGWMAMRFDATPKGLRALIDEYGLWPETTNQAAREDGKVGNPGKLKDRLAELHVRFAQGAGTTTTSREQLAELFECGASTIQYHHAKWVKAGGPMKAAPEVEGEPVTPVEAPALPTTVDDMLGIAPEFTGALTTEEHLADLREDQPQEPATAPKPVVALDRSPATVEQLQALQQHYSGTTQQADTQPTVPPRPKVAKLPEVGQVYEGEVSRVDDRGNYALVNFYDGRTWLRGKVSRTELPIVGDVRERLRDGDTVNVVVLDVRTSAYGGKWHVDLSIAKAPAHPNEPERLRQLVRRQPEAPPITARGSDVAIVEAEVAATNPQAITRSAMIRSEPTEVVHVAVEQADLCRTCIKRDVCPLTDFYPETLPLPEEYKPDRAKAVRVIYSPRYVQECSAYRREEAV